MIKAVEMNWKLKEDVGGAHRLQIEWILEQCFCFDSRILPPYSLANISPSDSGKKATCLCPTHAALVSTILRLPY